jgi:hypothetical protein
MNGTASLADREIGRVLPANCRKVLFSGAAKDANEAASAAYFGGSKVRASIKPGETRPAIARFLGPGIEGYKFSGGDKTPTSDEIAGARAEHRGATADRKEGR